MTKSSRDFDIGVLGGTGFTGKLILKELAAVCLPSVKLATSSRKPEHLLEILRNWNLEDRFEVHQVDNNVQDQLDAFVGNCKVVIACAGPYIDVGIPVVDACVRLGTHYVDVTGELDFMRKIIDTYHERAKAQKVMIVPSCGFDCAPSDLGVYFLNESAMEKMDCSTKHVYGLMNLKSGMSSGTLRTAVSMASRLQTLTIPDAYVLNPKGDNEIKHPGMAKVPPEETDSSSIYRFSKFDEALSFNSTISMTNSRVVRRSIALFRAEHDSNHDQLVASYMERVQAHSFVNACLFTLGMKVFFPLIGILVAKFGFFRSFVESFLPLPGNGPSHKTRLSNYFELRLVAEGTNGEVVKGSVCGPDPYDTTAITASAAALLALDATNSPISSRPSGVLTPAVAFGSDMIARAIQRGLKFCLTSNSTFQSL